MFHPSQTYFDIFSFILFPFRNGLFLVFRIGRLFLNLLRWWGSGWSLNWFGFRRQILRFLALLPFAFALVFGWSGRLKMKKDKHAETDSSKMKVKQHTCKSCILSCRSSSSWSLYFSLIFFILAFWPRFTCCCCCCCCLLRDSSSSSSSSDSFSLTGFLFLAPEGAGFLADLVGPVAEAPAPGSSPMMVYVSSSDTVETVRFRLEADVELLRSTTVSGKAGSSLRRFVSIRLRAASTALTF